MQPIWKNWKKFGLTFFAAALIPFSSSLLSQSGFVTAQTPFSATEMKQVVNQYCLACHQSNGKGASGRFPPLNGTDWVIGDKERLVHIILNGMEGEIEVNGEIYDGVMPQHSFLNDDQIADVLTYIRTNFDNQASSLSAEEVEKFRETFVK